MTKMKCFHYLRLSVLFGPGGSDSPELVLPNITWDILILKKYSLFIRKSSSSKLNSNLTEHPIIYLAALLRV